MSYDGNLIISLINSIKQKDLFDFLLNINTRNLVFIISVIFIISGILIYFLFVNSIRTGWSNNCKVSNVTNESHEHLEFLATYVMPLVFTDVTSKRTVINLFLMITAIGAIYIKTNKFYSNPSLAILGFKIYKGTIHDRGERNVVIITRSTIESNSLIQYIKIDQDTCLARKV